MMKLTVRDALQTLTEERKLFTRLYGHGSLEIEIYRPKEIDHQQPHARDELYVVATGTAEFVCSGERASVSAGDVLFAPARAEHRFEHFSDDFATWVFFYGPEGGESG
jgi:mannose-6-phosphate isomerase-like protein (cupin superfamily)